MAACPIIFINPLLCNAKTTFSFAAIIPVHITLACAITNCPCSTNHCEFKIVNFAVSYALDITLCALVAILVARPAFSTAPVAVAVPNPVNPNALPIFIATFFIATHI